MCVAIDSSLVERTSECLQQHSAMPSAVLLSYSIPLPVADMAVQIQGTGMLCGGCFSGGIPLGFAW